MAEPKVELSLLVPSTRCGGMPAVSKAGVVSRPPATGDGIDETGDEGDQGQDQQG